METRGEMVGLSERPMVGQEEARSEAGRGAPACAGAPEREGGMEGGAEQRQAWLLRELQGVNRQLSHEVSTLANENLRLKSAATTADMSLLEAAVAQLSSRDVAAERAVPDIVKAALQWDQHIAGKNVSAPRPGCSAGGGLEEGAGPAERGRVMASAALLKRLGLQIGQHVRLKRDMSRDRLGTKVHVSGGASWGCWSARRRQAAEMMPLCICTWTMARSASSACLRSRQATLRTAGSRWGALWLSRSRTM